MEAHEGSTTERRDGRLRLVGIGASAGGLESLERLFGAIPAEPMVAFLVVQHLSPDHPSMMAELLARVSPMSVAVATHGQPIVPNTVTLIPPGQFLTVSGGHLVLEPKPRPPALTLPIDRLFESMADEWGGDAVAVVLSGTGTDGTRGAARIRTVGGFVAVEDPAGAQFDGMPRSVIDAGLADLIADAGELGAFLARLDAVEVLPRSEPAEPDADALGRIVRLLRRETAIDFEHYKRATIGRRVARRMTAHDLTDAHDYLTLLAASEEERALLFRELLIRVTSFFRDPEVWASVAESVLVPLVADRDRHDVLRLWVPACSTGEEAYTLAMLALDEVERQGRDLDVKVFATDVDRDALEIASRGRYRKGQMTGVDEARLERYFTEVDGVHTVSSALRRSVMFAPHNVTNDAPFTRLDIISCRNLFIYLNADLQARVLRGFHFALRAGGALVLGTSEGLGEQ
ncbi:MAG: chemotaxis protein CheB, partial [Acidimicrobiia bacterium]